MKKVVYMDAAASWLKPQSVIDNEVKFLSAEYANAGRGICARVDNIDKIISKTREEIADFINAKPNQIVFTAGTTDSSNRIVDIIMDNLSVYKCKKHPIVAVSDLDHHSARLPWENLAKHKKCSITVCPLDDELNIDINNIPKADIFVITAMSNVIGVSQNVSKIIQIAKHKNPNVITIVDAAQFVVHDVIDVVNFNCDFLCFSGHKIGSDTGIGILYIRNPQDLYPDRFGGGMIKRLKNNEMLFSEEPYKFEAGTLPLTQIVGLSAALKYVSQNKEYIQLMQYMYDELYKIPQIKIISPRQSNLLTFVIKDKSVLDCGVLLGGYNICARVGNMCATWIHKYLNLDGTIRLSIGPWNTLKEIKYVICVIKKIIRTL